MSFPAGAYALAIRSSFHQQWKELARPMLIYSPAMQMLGPAVVIAWIVSQTTNPLAISYAVVGSGLMQIWMWTVHRTGWSVATEHDWGTLELLMTTRTPLPVVMFGKCLAALAFMSIPGALVSLLVLAASPIGLPPVAHPVAFGLAVALTMATVVATSFIFAPVAFLVGARGGFFNGIMPLGAAIAGFAYPTRLLPPALQALSAGAPTSWGMSAVIRAQSEHALTAAFFRDCALAALLTLGGFGFSLWMFGVVEKRVRVIGNLGKA